MAVSLLPRRLFYFLCKVLRQGIQQQNKKVIERTLKLGKRNFGTRAFHQKNPGPILYKINLAHFYNGSKPLYNVPNTYENLINQKANQSADKKCSADKPNPGRHKFHKEVEAALNDQIEIEFNACFAYLSMACYYGRTEVALPGCQGYFMMMHNEEHEHAIIFANYVLMRGGHVKVPSIPSLENTDWKDISKTFACAVEMESQVKEKLEALLELADKHGDHQLADFITAEFLEEQNKSIQTMARLLTRSKMVKSEVGEYLFDQHLYDSFVKHSEDNMMYTTKLPEGDTRKVYK